MKEFTIKNTYESLKLDDGWIEDALEAWNDDKDNAWKTDKKIFLSKKSKWEIARKSLSIINNEIKEKGRSFSDCIDIYNEKYINCNDNDFYDMCESYL